MNHFFALFCIAKAQKNLIIYTLHVLTLPCISRRKTFIIQQCIVLVSCLIQLLHRYWPTFIIERKMASFNVTFPCQHSTGAIPTHKILEKSGPFTNLDTRQMFFFAVETNIEKKKCHRAKKFMNVLILKPLLISIPK